MSIKHAIIIFGSFLITTSTFIYLMILGDIEEFISEQEQEDAQKEQDDAEKQKESFQAEQNNAEQELESLQKEQNDVEKDLDKNETVITQKNSEG